MASFLSGSRNKISSVLMYHYYCHQAEIEIIRLQTKELAKRQSKRVYTTRTPALLGLHELWGRTQYGKGVIIGIIDSGISIHHPCFHDNGVPPPPKKWKGRCEYPGRNNKFIGFRDLLFGFDHPFDNVGHGTFVSSVAAGNFIRAFDQCGNAIGEAAGIAPLAHIAVYKVASKGVGVVGSAIESAMGAAIEDGVDVIMLAIGSKKHIPFRYDVSARASLLAVYSRILVVGAAGNFGPSRSTMTNEAPWILTVAASTKPDGMVTPTVTYFSSRGPNFQSPGILKPDIICPGDDTFGASNIHTRKATFVVDSGTSIACSILTGIVALVRNVHPDWSPAAIKSSLMTTADPIKGADVFEVGAGFVNASKAVDPGLVFDIHPDDYVAYLLGLGYREWLVKIMLGRELPSISKTIKQAELNLPSFAITLKRGEKRRYERTVTNVGKADSVYKIEWISTPVGLTVDVNPTELKFTQLNEKLTLTATFERESERKYVCRPEYEYVHGSIRWGDGKHSVRVPFSVKLA